MDISRIAELVKQGKIITTAEFRSAVAEKRSFTWDGRNIEAKGVTYNLEIGGRPATFTKQLDDKADLEAWNKSFPAKGSPVLVEFTPEPCMGAKAQRGTYKLRVDVQPLPVIEAKKAA